MLTTGEIAALVASVREAEGKMTPGDWTGSVRCSATGCARHTSVEITSSGKPNKSYPSRPGVVAHLGHTHHSDGPCVNPADIEGIALLRNSALPLCDAIEELQQRCQEYATALFHRTDQLREAAALLDQAANSQPRPNAFDELANQIRKQLNQPTL